MYLIINGPASFDKQLKNIFQTCAGLEEECLFQFSLRPSAGPIPISHFLIQEVFRVYLNKFEIGVSHLFLIIFSNYKFTLVNLISRNNRHHENNS